MKNYALCILSLAFLVGCDAPQRTRAPQLYSNSLGDPNTGNFSNSGSNSGIGTGNSTGSGSGNSGGQTPPTSTPGFENCDLSNKYHSIDVGFFGICQNSQDETLIKFKTELASSSVRICLIPTYKDATDSSAYIGQPQCTTTTANSVIQGRLYKDRSGFTGRPLNGVIVMKEPLLPEYFNCMQAYVNWPANACSSGAYSTADCNYAIQRCPIGGGGIAGECDTAAKAYMSQVCNSFKSKYSNAYSDIRLKN